MMPKIYGNIQHEKQFSDSIVRRRYGEILRCNTATSPYSWEIVCCNMVSWCAKHVFTTRVSREKYTPETINIGIMSQNIRRLRRNSWTRVYLNGLFHERDIGQQGSGTERAKGVQFRPEQDIESDRLSGMFSKTILFSSAVHYTVLNYTTA